MADIEPVNNGPFEVDMAPDYKMAAAMMYELRRIDRDIADAARRYEAEMEVVADARDDALADLSERRSRVHNELTQWHSALVDSEHRAGVHENDISKTVEFAAGELKMRRYKPTTKAVVVDETAALEWAQEHEPAIVTTTVKLDKAGAKRLVTADGLAIPGVEIEPVEARETYNVTPHL